MSKEKTAMQIAIEKPQIEIAISKSKEYNLILDCKELKQQKHELIECLERVLNIVKDSTGISGYHLNGAVAEWDEFTEIEYAQELLNKIKQSK